MKMGPVFFCVALPAALHAQTQASLGAGAGAVRYAGDTTFGAVTLSPALQFTSPSLFFGANGSVSAMQGGAWASQGRADLWAAPARRASTRPFLALSATGWVSTRSDGVAGAALSALGELTWARPTVGASLGAGLAGGVIEREPGIAALRLRARVWWQGGSLSVEPTRFLGAWYTDVLAGVTVDRARLLTSLWASARVSATYGSKGAASATLQYFATPTLALEASAGGYLADPFQGLPRAAYATAGIRIHTRARPLATPRSSAPRLTPLIASRRGDSVVVRFRMTGARSVAIAGDWNTWTPTPLNALGGDIWEGAFVLARGTYHFSLRVDGEWVVPGGVAVVSDGMGGLVALLTVL
jgi:hypothetical protein